VGARRRCISRDRALLPGCLYPERP
jgi:hypothetical protein